MSKKIHHDETFVQQGYSQQVLPAEFSSCTFTGCNFTGARLSAWDLENCTFRDCNFSMAGLTKTKLRDVNFTGCKLMGIDFSVCDSFLFSAHFTQCQLDYASFYKRKMKKPGS